MGIATPATDRHDLASIAYGFMASKALFSALEIELFTHLAAGPRGLHELSVTTGVPPNRLRTLLNALTALGLLLVDGDCYTNAPACQRYLVRGAPGDYGEYFRLQVGGQIYPALLHLDAGLAGTGVAFDSFSDLMAEPAAARTFTTAQHTGSLAAARALADRMPLAGAARLLDVGGGSGAFSIAFCERNPALRATVLDFPAVLDVARDYCDDAGLAGRIELRGGDALHCEWPADQDVVLMSYLLSALGDGEDDSEVDGALARAWACLRPGGLLVVHDFMLDDPGRGPTFAALWFLQYLSYRPDAASFSGAGLRDRLCGAGFDPGAAEVLIPEITKVILARKVDR